MLENAQRSSCKLRNVIVGGGQTGARAARAMRDAGFEGAITLFCEEPHLPYERPELSKALLKDHDREVPFVFDDADYRAMDVKVETGSPVVAIDRAQRSITLADGRTEPYDNLLLATGSSVRLVKIPDFPADRIFHLRTIEDCQRLRELTPQSDIAILGGGFIGLEVAATLSELGHSVTVIELADQILARLDCRPVSELVQTRHQDNGIEFKIGRKVVGSDGGILHLDDGTNVAADYVIGGIGIVPNTDLAAKAGLRIDNGIVTDEFGRTEDPAIFAAGDVAFYFHPVLKRQVRLESWQSANEQAKAVGRAMAGVWTPTTEVPWVWSDQGQLNLQMAGAPDGCDRKLYREEGAGQIIAFQFDQAALVGAITVNSGKSMHVIRRLLASGQLALPPEDLTDQSVPLRNFLVRT